MNKIPLPKYIFESVYAAYDLRCYCGEADRNIFGPDYLPGNFTNVAAGEVVQLFAPGKQTKLKSIVARILCADPIKIQIIEQQ